MFVWQQEWKSLLIILIVFLLCYYLPIGIPRFDHAVLEALYLVNWYAQEHVLLCLVPAFFIAGAISVFISQASVMKYLGARANKILAYGVASVSGAVLAVCSCTVLPLFAGIYRMGAGIGPATAFLYSGPAINVLAIVLTARVLGLEMGIARIIGAILFSIIIGLLMHLIYRREEIEKVNNQMFMPDPDVKRPLWQNSFYFACMVAVLVFANWAKPNSPSGLWYGIYLYKWQITATFALLFGFVLIFWFSIKTWKIISTGLITLLGIFWFPQHPHIPFTIAVIGLGVITSTDQGELGEWFNVTWSFTKQILPLLLAGVFVSGFLLGRPDKEGILPSPWIYQLVGGNSFSANFFASVVGAFMYFATLTEIPILQGLIGSGMGKGPALALLLAGPALSLPSMIVLRSIMGTQKTVIYVGLVIIMSTTTGIIYGALF